MTHVGTDGDMLYIVAAACGALGLLSVAPAPPGTRAMWERSVSVLSGFISFYIFYLISFFFVHTRVTSNTFALPLFHSAK